MTDADLRSTPFGRRSASNIGFVNLAAVFFLPLEYLLEVDALGRTFEDRERRLAPLVPPEVDELDAGLPPKPMGQRLLAVGSLRRDMVEPLCVLEGKVLYC